MNAFDRLGARQDAPWDCEPQKDFFGFYIYPGEIVLEMPNGDMIHPGDFKQYVEGMEEYALRELLGVSEVEAS